MFDILLCYYKYTDYIFNVDESYHFNHILILDMPSLARNVLTLLSKSKKLVMVTAELSQFYILMSSIIPSSLFAHYFFKFSTYKNNNVEILKKLLTTYIIIVLGLNKFLIYIHITYPLHRLSTI